MTFVAIGALRANKKNSGLTVFPYTILVYKEVEQKIQELQEILYQKLMKLPNSLEEQKKLIR